MFEEQLDGISRNRIEHETVPKQTKDLSIHGSSVGISMNNLIQRHGCYSNDIPTYSS